MMNNVKLPDIKRLKAVKQRLKNLPPQKLATDTSNWENRNVSAVTFDSETQKKKVRKVDFMLDTPMQNLGIPLKEAQKLFLAAKGFTPKQIEQMLRIDPNVGRPPKKL